LRQDEHGTVQHVRIGASKLEPIGRGRPGRRCVGIRPEHETELSLEARQIGLRRVQRAIDGNVLDEMREPTLVGLLCQRAHSHDEREHSALLCGTDGARDKRDSVLQPGNFQVRIDRKRSSGLLRLECGLDA
jgi:hypothetical protein